MGLYQKIANVILKTGAVIKAGENESQDYSYVRWKEQAEAVRKIAAEEGLALIASVEEEEHSTTIEPDRYGKDRPTAWSHVKVKLSIVDTEETPATEYLGPIHQEHTVYGFGSAKDLGDKAVFKATTGALKYALRAAFLIPDTDGDPEADESIEPGESAKKSKSPKSSGNSKDKSKFKTHQAPTTQAPNQTNPSPSPKSPSLAPSAVKEQTAQTGSAPSVQDVPSKDAPSKDVPSNSRLGAPIHSKVEGIDAGYIPKAQLNTLFSELRKDLGPEKAMSKMNETCKALFGHEDPKKILTNQASRFADAIRQRDLITEGVLE